MRKLKQFNILASAFELVVSTVPLIVSYLIIVFGLTISNIYTNNKVSPISFVVVANTVTTMCTDIELLCMFIFLGITSLVSIVKCTIIKFIGDFEHLFLHKVYLYLCMFYLITVMGIFITAVYNSIILLSGLTLLMMVLECYTIILNMNYIEQLYYTRRR